MNKIRFAQIAFTVMILLGCSVNISAQQVVTAKNDSAIKAKAANDSIRNDSIKVHSVDTIPQYLSSKVKVTLPKNMMGLTLSGRLKMKSNERIQLSLLMPIFANEIAKLDITPNDMLLIDRYDKLYVKATKKELEKYLPKGSSYSQIEEILTAASKPGGKSELQGDEIGLQSMKDAKVQLYEFSNKEIELEPTAEPTKYKKVSLEEFVKALKGLR